MNWEHDASVPVDFALPPLVDAGARDAAFAVDAAASNDLGVSNPAFPEDNYDQAFDGDNQGATGAATAVNTRPGWSLPEVVIDASIEPPDGGVDATSP